ncbi:MAG TPA: hypothetical protein VJ984_05020 [Xanthomonadales bacterium]|nr:hypothetical protein [Xanthomonadales bacterium]
MRKKNLIKRQVAAEAARIIATEGQYNYHAAKRKAASRIGVSERLALPANLEVQEALSAYLELYGGEAHRQNLENMRASAVRAMLCYESWNARLVGPVLDGTAGNHARITLHVFCDSPDQIVHHLMENKTPFSQEQRQIRWHDGRHRTLPLLVVESEPYTVELLVFDELQLRQSPPCPIDGRPQKRASHAEVSRLLKGPKPQAA